MLHLKLPMHQIAPKSSIAKCSKSIQTSYSPERPEIVYCEQCYLQEIY